MKKARFTENQIIGILRKADAGMPVKEICRPLGISDATYYNWKSKYGGMSASHLKRLKEMERELCNSSGCMPTWPFVFRLRVDPALITVFNYKQTDGNGWDLSKIINRTHL
jgi:putative transposase